MYTETLDDFQKKYEGCFVFLTLKDSNYLVKYRGLGEESGTLLFESPDFGDILVSYKDYKNNVKFTFPQRGMFNINGQACLFCRVPARQWKRAPHKGNCTFIPVLSTLNLVREELKLTIDTMEQLYFPFYPTTVNDALKLLERQESIALNNKLSLSISDIDGSYLVWYNLNPVGYLTDNKLTIKDTLFEQEILDVIRDKGLLWQI